MQSIYKFLYTVHKLYNIKRQKSLPHRVISVGNITVGGTGKTPTVISIAEDALKRGYQPIILTRGYRGKRIKPVFVIENKDLDINLYCNDPKETGDEPLLISSRLPCVPVVKSRSRYDGGMFALDNLDRFTEDTDCSIHSRIVFILDDGFQHWRLYRDVDVVVVDGLNPFGNQKLLPLGRLREPLSELKRADVLLITRSFKQEIVEIIRKYNKDANIFFAKINPFGLIDALKNRYPLSELNGKRIFAFSGIGNNEQFKKMIQDITTSDIHFMGFDDHHYYSTYDISNIKDEADKLRCNIILTTEKDLIKIKYFQPLATDIYALQISLEIEPEFFHLLYM